MTDIERYFCKVGQRIPTDRQGLLLCNRLCGGALFDSKKLLASRRCCIIGESGIGKTEFIRAHCKSDDGFKVFYAPDLGRVDIILRIRKSCSSLSKKSIVIVLDGVDSSASSLLSEFVEVMNEHKKTRFIVTATDCRVGEYLCNVLPGVVCVTMAPLRVEDIRVIAEERLGGDDGEVFYKAVEKANLFSICRTPLGVNVLCGYWQKSRRLSPSRVELLRRFVSDLCEMNANGNTFARDKYSSTQYHSCAKTIAGAMLISGCRLIELNRNVRSGEYSLSLADVFSGEDMEVAALLLKRAVFSPVERGCYSFSHRLYYNMLASEWVCDEVAEKERTSLFVDENKCVVFPQNAEVAAIVALRDKDLFDKLISIAPEYLMLNAAEMSDTQKERTFQSFVAVIGQGRRIYAPEGIRLEMTSSKKNSAWVAKRVRKYASLPEQELRILLSAYRKFGIDSESKTMVSIVLDSKMTPRIRIAAMPLIKIIDDPKTQQRMLCLLKPRQAEKDSDEVSFKSCLVSTLHRLGFDFEKVLPGIVSMAHIDTRNTISRYMRELRSNFVAMLNSIQGRRSSVSSILDFACECFVLADCNYDVRVMATWAFQFAWMRARGCDAISILSRTYAHLLLQGINPLKFYNREITSGSILTEQRLRADHETIRDVVASVVESPEFPNDVAGIIAHNRLLITPNDEVWIEQRMNECGDSQTKTRWMILLDAARQTTPQSMSQHVSNKKGPLGTDALMMVLQRRTPCFQDVLAASTGKNYSDMSCVIERMIQNLSGENEAVVLKVCDMAIKYLRHSIGSWKGVADDGSANVFGAIAVVLTFAGRDMLDRLADKNLKRLFLYMLDDGGLMHQKALSPLIREFERRFSARLIDLLYEQWGRLKATESTSIIKTTARFLKRQSVEVFKQRMRNGRLGRDFCELMISALLDDGHPSRCENMRIFAEYVQSKCLDSKGSPKIDQGTLFFWYCYFQISPGKAMSIFLQFSKVRINCFDLFFKLLESRPLFDVSTLTIMQSGELKKAFDFIATLAGNRELDFENILSRLIVFNDDESCDAIEWLATRHPKSLQWERWLSIVELQRRARAFSRIPREQVAKKLRKYCTSKEKDNTMIIPRNLPGRLLWVAVSTGIATLVTIAIYRIVGNKSDSAGNLQMNVRIDRSIRADQSRNIGNSQKLDFKGAVFNGPVSIQTEKKVESSSFEPK